MSRFFDIRPPKPQSNYKKNISAKSSTKPRKQKSGSGILFIIIGICIFIFIFSLTNNTSSSYEQKDNTPQTNEIDNLATTENSPKPTSNPFITPSDKSQNDTTTNPTNIDNESQTQSNEIQITVLNGSSLPGIADKAKNILEENNIKVTDIGNTDNPYSKTVIYYSENNTETTKKIQETLSAYNPSLEINSEFANDKKILIVIGEE